MYASKKVAVFVHGFNGSHNSSTGKAVQEYLSHFNIDVILDDFNLLSPTETLKKIDELVSENNAVMLIGISLGAFYTLAYYSMPKIVINPCMFPSKEIPKLDNSIDENIVSEWKSLESKMYDIIDWEDRKYTVGLFADNDELFSYKDFFKETYGQTVSIPGGHHTGKNVYCGLDIAIEKLGILDDNIDYTKEECDLYNVPETSYKESSTRFTEKMISVLPKEASSDRVKNYGPKIYSMLVDGYSSIGGMKGCNSYDDFVRDSDFWKICTVNGEIEAVCIYKFSYGGRKLSYVSAKKDRDGHISKIAKEALIKIMYEDINSPGPQGKMSREMWAEVSGAIEHMYMKYAKANIIPPDIVKELMPNKKIEVCDDNQHYTRNIGDTEVRKLCIGNAPKKD